MFLSATTHLNPAPVPVVGGWVEAIACVKRACVPEAWYGTECPARPPREPALNMSMPTWLRAHGSSHRKESNLRLTAERKELEVPEA